MTDSRQRFSSGNIWERSAGFSRAVRVGNTVYTAGTIAVNQEGIVQGKDCYEQCQYITRLLEGVLADAGASLRDVVQVRAYMTNKADAEQWTRFLGEVFGEIKPAATGLFVSSLFGEGTVVELEFVAVID